MGDAAAVTDDVTGVTALKDRAPAARAPDGRARAALWTPAKVEDRLAEAVRVLARLPTPGLSQLGMDVVRNAAEAYGREEARVVPSASDISAADAAMGWTAWLPERHRKLVVARAGGLKWRRLAREFGRSERSLQGHHKLAIVFITAKLNGGSQDACALFAKKL